MIEVVHDTEFWAPNTGGQAGFMNDFVHRYCAMCGGWDSGKTWAGTRKHLTLHTYNAFDEFGQPTFVDSLIVAQTYQLALSVNIPRIKEALAEANLSYTWNGDSKVFAFVLTDFGTKRRPVHIWVRSADAAAAIAGFEVGNVYGDEVARWPYNRVDPLSDAWLQADGRLRGVKPKIKQFNMTYTPEGDNTRVYRDFELRPKVNHKLYRSHTRENVLGGGVEFAEILETQLSPDLANQYLGGNAISLGGGKVYPYYQPVRHCRKILKLDPDLPLDLSIDFNISPGMHGEIGQHSEDGFGNTEMITTAYELHSYRMNARQMIAEFEKLLQLIRTTEKYELKWPVNVYGDASGQGEWAATGESMWDIVEQSLKQHRISYTLCIARKNPDVSDRVNAVNSAFMSFDGRVRYRCHERCAKLHQDYEELKWKDGKVDKVDRLMSHPSDADGYRVWYLMPVMKPEATTPTAVLARRR